MFSVRTISSPSFFKYALGGLLPHCGGVLYEGEEEISDLLFTTHGEREKKEKKKRKKKKERKKKKKKKDESWYSREEGSVK